ncbi:hypothetical protein Scep_016485 [Stephania cephalantha]|uniref:Uncharacterized protein n=1 Tax=Stephania cephalantha TaxID=152367 RepID=A0AAP0IMX6_9MAGN
MAFYYLNLLSLLLLFLHGMAYASNVANQFHSDGLHSLQFSQKRSVPKGPNPAQSPDTPPTKFHLQFSRKHLVPTGPNPAQPPEAPPINFLPKAVHSDGLASLQFSKKRRVPRGPNPQVPPSSTKFLPKDVHLDRVTSLQFIQKNRVPRGPNLPKVVHLGKLASLQFSQKRRVPKGPNPQVPPSSTNFLPNNVHSDGLASLQFSQKRLVPKGPNPQVPPSSTNFLPNNVHSDGLASYDLVKSSKASVPKGPNPQVPPSSTNFLPNNVHSDGLASLQFSQKRLVPKGPNPQVPPSSTNFLPNNVHSDGLASLQFSQKRRVTRGDGGTPITDRESSCVGVRDDLRRPSGHSKQGGYRYLRRSPIGGSRRLVPGRGAPEEESGFRPSALRGGDGKYYAVAACNKESFDRERRRGGHGSEQGRQHDVIVQTPVHEFDDSGSKATPRKRLVKKSGDEREDADFGIEDEKPAFMRDEFASEPPSVGACRRFIWPRSRDEGVTDTVAGGFEDDQEGVRTMDDDNFIDDTLEWIRWPCGGDNEGFIGDAPRLEKDHGTRESLDILLGKAISYNPR